MKRKVEILVFGGWASVSAGVWMRSGLDAGLITAGIGLMVAGIMFGIMYCADQAFNFDHRRRK